MRPSFVSVLLAAASCVSAAPVVEGRGGALLEDLAEALPLEQFQTHQFSGKTLEQLQALAAAANESSNATPKTMAAMSTAATTCSNPRVRIEWDDMSNSDRQLFVNAVLCLRGKAPSGQFSQAKNRYEDLVALHQTLTPNVHNNNKFLIWHRYFLWTFEDILRDECGFTGPLPWFDETRYSGKFSTSSIFSSSWFGAIALGGKCVTDGQFKNTNLYVGPGTSNVAHCLSRNGQASLTANTNANMVNTCNSISDYAQMEPCQEDGVHAYGHNGIGAVMQDVYASPGDPVFWLHHGFVDRNYRIWQGGASSRISTIDGTDHSGNALTLSTTVSMNGMRPTVTISQLLNTLGTTLCYKYNY